MVTGWRNENNIALPGRIRTTDHETLVLVKSGFSHCRRNTPRLLPTFQPRRLQLADSHTGCDDQRCSSILCLL
jgi:hypothetical protein